MNVDGSDQRALTANRVDDRHPAWSPDGRSIAFTGNRRARVDALYVMRADGSAPARLLDPDLPRRR